MGQMRSHMGVPVLGGRPGSARGMRGPPHAVAPSVGNPGSRGAGLHACGTGGPAPQPGGVIPGSSCCLCGVPGTWGPSGPSASRHGHGQGGSEPAQGTPPSLGAPNPCVLQEEARHTTIKNITSVLFGICYSARVTGYKYILQRASSPSAMPGAGAGARAGCRAGGVLAPGSRASRHRCVTAASVGSVCQPDRLAQGQGMVSPQGPVPSSCLPRPWVPAPTVGG